MRAIFFFFLAETQITSNSLRPFSASNEKFIDLLRTYSWYNIIYVAAFSIYEEKLQKKKQAGDELRLLYLFLEKRLILNKKRRKRPLSCITGKIAQVNVLREFVFFIHNRLGKIGYIKIT